MGSVERGEENISGVSSSGIETGIAGIPLRGRSQSNTRQGIPAYICPRTCSVRGFIYTARGFNISTRNYYSELRLAKLDPLNRVDDFDILDVVTVMAESCI